MAVRSVVFCDRCGKRGQGCRPVYANVRRFTDAAGSMDTEQVTVDLCGDCCAGELTYLLTDNLHVGASWWDSFQQKVDE